MQIIFNGSTIAQEFPEGGFDAVTGFEPDGDQQVQITPLLRGSWPFLAARGNCTMTMTGQIVPAPAPTIGEAIFAFMMWMASMPKSGPLLFQQDGVQTTFALGVLKKCRALKHQGVSYAIELTFVGVNPTQTNVITDSGGGTITDSSGNPVTDSSG
jgi:hypothetical protein